jgi:hypothetical protein
MNDRNSKAEFISFLLKNRFYTLLRRYIKCFTRSLLCSSLLFFSISTVTWLLSVCVSFLFYFIRFFISLRFPLCPPNSNIFLLYFCKYKRVREIMSILRSQQEIEIYLLCVFLLCCTAIFLKVLQTLVFFFFISFVKILLYIFKSEEKKMNNNKKKKSPALVFAFFYEIPYIQMNSFGIH